MKKGAHTWNWPTLLMWTTCICATLHLRSGKMSNNSSINLVVHTHTHTYTHNFTILQLDKYCEVGNRGTHAYTSDALEQVPLSITSGAMCVIVPWNRLDTCVSKWSMRTLRPKSLTCGFCIERQNARVKTLQRAEGRGGHASTQAASECAFQQILSSTGSILGQGRKKVMRVRA
eukprot:1161363-Pelagomonas_calceolata.AAC.7